MTAFQQNFSEWFHERLSSNVVTVSERKTKQNKTKNFETIKNFKSFDVSRIWTVCISLVFLLLSIMNFLQYQSYYFKILDMQDKHYQNVYINKVCIEK